MGTRKQAKASRRRRFKDDVVVVFTVRNYEPVGEQFRRLRAEKKRSRRVRL